MTTATVIDSDAHVDETEATWEFIPPESVAFKPVLDLTPNADPTQPPTPSWLIDGVKKRRPVRDDAMARSTVETRELLDVEARLRRMDQLGIDVQVVYPTLFITEAAARPEADLGVTQSYNRWIADRCAQAKGRLRWICVPPMLSIERAVQELRFAKDHGACGIFKKGDLEAGRWPSDPYFFPLYEEAERLDMPVCFHTSTAAAESGPTANRGTLFIRRKAPAINGIVSLLTDSIPGMFPKLRFGCIEAGASWIPMIDHSLRHDLLHFSGTAQSRGYEVADDLFKANRVYVSCLVDEDLPMILRYISDDNLLIGSDYSHNDSSQAHEFRRLLQARADSGELAQSTVDKILHDNPKAFYAL